MTIRILGYDDLQSAAELCADIERERTGKLPSKFIIKYHLNRSLERGFLIGYFGKTQMEDVLSATFNNPEQSVCQFGNLGVMLGKREQGIGTQLMTSALEHAEKQGCFLTHLTVATKNLSAIRIYERLGYQPTPMVSHDHMQMARCSDSIPFDPSLLTL